MRKAYIAGINHYEHFSPLFGCVDDAYSVKAALEQNGDGTVNFDCRLDTATGPSDQVTKARLKDAAEELFRDDADVALFFFAGHGHVEAAGGFLLGSDSSRGDEGLSLGELIIYANDSPAKNRLIVLDSCHSGAAGTSSINQAVASIAEGVTVLTASTAEQYATELDGKGVFTSLFVDALYGGAANLTGDITPGSVYAHIDQSLGAWEQRPVFRTNVKQFVSLRKVTAPISLQDLRRLPEFFASEGDEFSLDPTFEPEMKGRDKGMPLPIPENTRTFAILQRYNRLNLLVPIEVDHMWNAAMQSTGCRLTRLGQHYHRLVTKKRI